MHKVMRDFEHIGVICRYRRKDKEPLCKALQQLFMMNHCFCLACMFYWTALNIIKGSTLKSAEHFIVKIAWTLGLKKINGQEPYMALKL